MLNVNELAGFGAGGKLLTLRPSAGFRAGASTVAVPVPAHEPGDLLVAVIAARNATAITAVPAGWVQKLHSVSGGDLVLAIYMRPATDSEPSSYTWSSNGGSDASLGVIIPIGGAVDVAPVGAVATGTNVAVSAPSIDRADEGILFAVYVNKDNSRVISTPPPDMVLQFSISAQPGINVYAESPSPGGVSGSRDAVWSSGIGRTASVLFQVI